MCLCGFSCVTGNIGNLQRDREKFWIGEEEGHKQRTSNLGVRVRFGFLFLFFLWVIW